MEILAVARPRQIGDVFWRLLGVEPALAREFNDELLDDSDCDVIPARTPVQRGPVGAFMGSASASVGVPERMNSSGPPPPWSIAFANDFIKETKQLDTKLMGRILACLEAMSRLPYPFTPHGDTLKPLRGPLDGQWRYRIGDHRVIVQPQPEKATIAALTIAARGSVYD